MSLVWYITKVLFTMGFYSTCVFVAWYMIDQYYAPMEDDQ